MKRADRNSAFGTIVVVALLAGPVFVPAWAAESGPSGRTSQFAKEIDSEAYRKAVPPTGTPVFRWDFSEAGVVHTYSFQQEVRGVFNMESSSVEDAGNGRQEMSTQGLLLVKSQGDGTAELVLKDMKASTKMETGGAEPRFMDQQLPPVVIQGMKEDGSGAFDKSQDTLMRLLFPLPTGELKLGDSVDVPAQMPFNAMGSALKVTGRSRITFTQYVEIGDHICAQLDIDTDISELKVPAELEGDYSCSAKGTSVFYFDTATHTFVAGTVALIMQFTIDAPMPQMKMSGEDVPDMPKRSKAAMASDNLIRVVLKE